MSGVSEIGIRMSLVGGKEVATQSLAVADSIKTIGTEAEAAGAKATAASGGIDTMTASFGKLDESALISTNSMRDFQAETTLASLDATEAMIRLDMVVNEVGISEEGLAAKTGVMGAVLDTTSISTEKLGEDFKKLGHAVAFTSAAIGAAVVYETSKMALGYGTTTAQIAATADMSVSAAKKITDAFLHTNGSVTYNAQEMASAFQPISGQLESLNHGALTVHTSMMFMNAAMNLASASGEQLSTDTQSLTSVMQAFGLGVGQAANVSNILFNTSRLTATSTTALANTMDNLHRRLGQVMPSLADTSGLMLDLANKGGVTGTRGINMVSGALTTLLSRTPVVSSMLGRLGLNINSFVGPGGSFIGMANAIGVLQPRLATLNQAQQILAETSLFGSGAAEAMGKTVLAGAAAYDTQRAAAIRANAVQQAANKVTQDLSGQIDILKKDFHNAGIIIGQFVLPKLVAFGKWMMDHKPVIIALAGVIGTVLVAAVAAWGVTVARTAIKNVQDFAKMGGALLKWARENITSWGETDAATVTGAEVQSGSWLSVAAAATTAFIAENIASLGIIAGIALLVGAIIFLATHWQRVWGDIQNWTLDAWNFVVGVWKGVASWFSGVVRDIANVGKGMWDFMYNSFVKVANSIIVAYDHTLGWIPGMHVNTLHTIGGKTSGTPTGGVSPGTHGAEMTAMVHGGMPNSPTQNIYSATGTTTSPVMLGQHVSKVSPGSTNSSAVPSQVVASAAGSPGQPHVVQLVVDRKVLAELVYTEMKNGYARR